MPRRKLLVQIIAEEKKRRKKPKWLFGMVAFFCFLIHLLRIEQKKSNTLQSSQENS